MADAASPPATPVTEPAEAKSHEPPPTFEEVVPLTDEEIASFGSRLRAIAEKNDEEALDLLISSVLWEASLEERGSSIVPAMVDVMMELFRGASGKEAKKGAYLRTFARPILRVLFRLSLNPESGTVVFRRGKAGAPCVIMFGFAGSVIADMKPAEAFYVSQGFSVIVTTGCYTTRRLKQRQWLQIGQALKEALQQEGTRLLVHSVSGHGISMMDNLVAMWTRGMPPLDGLPDLLECVSAWVFECVPGTLSVRPENPDKIIDYVLLDMPEDDEEAADMLMEGDAFVFVGAASNSLEKLFSQYSSYRWFSLAGHNKDLSVLLRSVRPDFDPFEATPYGATLSFWRHNPEYTRLEAQHWKEKANRPRLILYGAEDTLMRPESVEYSIDQQWTLLAKGTRLLAEKCMKSGHCELWVKDKSTCERGLKSLLKAAKLRKV